ncbi:Indeterminate(ID)-domain 7, putative [Theobroma cacao]|uniref:Indeterminate(ID)-domain 7, putative n=1 Tax=Theobroma cacao TaxID=3641 RepID=A0A061GL79_THECC|nr:Indeterminate(ID)-domain 7, putative [Theobroma cacao]
MMKSKVVEENMSNLTSTSGEVSASSGTRIETGTLYPQQSFASTNQAPPSKKKRSLPGNPDPDAEVIALSPKTLMATNRFICEICNKGFQRDQNLQLHKRGHNLPWKLKQRTNKELIRKKVYVCPEPTCVHHDPARALGDLTGIKKHFCRKHGEKKWKCEKCSKRYAVQSDWKAHSKICGTREYRCDCGTLFSRRDSFITHRAFCDALAEESARAITAANPLLPSNQPGSSVSHMTNLQPQLHSDALHALSVKREQDHLFIAGVPADSIPPWLTCPSGVGAGPGPPSTNLSSSSSPLFLDHPLAQNENPSQNPSSTLPPFQAPTASLHMSATALLQKAAQMGVTMSKPLQSAAAMQRPHQQTHMSGTAGFTGSTSASLATSTAGSGLGLSAREELGSGFPHELAFFGNKAAATSGFMEQASATNSTAGAGAGAAAPSLLHDMMSSLSSTSGFDGSSSFEQSLNGILDTKLGNSTFQQATLSKRTEYQLSRSDHEGRGSSASSNIGGNDGLTRDFLGLKAFPYRDFPNLAGLNRINSSSAYGQQNQHSQTPWQG